MDECGRIIGINSFGSLSDGVDAEFGFAVASNEIIAFLQAAKVNYNAISGVCRSSADIAREDAERERAEANKLAADQAAKREAQHEQYAAALQTAREKVIISRENHMMLAALFMVLAGACFTIAAYHHGRGKRQYALYAISGAVVLLVLALIIFLLRPAFNTAEDMASAAIADTEEDGSKNDTPALSQSGSLQCTILPERSRITVSKVEIKPFDWTETGCVNGRTQYGRSTKGWARIFVPNEEDVINIRNYNPDSQEYWTERYLLGMAQMEKARKIRGKYQYKGCSKDPEVIATLENMQGELQKLLPTNPNEKLVYRCTLTRKDAPKTDAKKANVKAAEKPAKKATKSEE